MTETERLLGLLTDTLRWQATLAAELAVVPSGSRVQEALLGASRATRELWAALHDTLARSQGLVTSAAAPPMPSGRLPEAP
jgi:hypothetical protein